MSSNESQSRVQFASTLTAHRRQFASDNYAGVCPEAWAAMAEANGGSERSYGDDNWTEQAANLIRDVFETDCEVFFVFNGTAANSLALASLCQIVSQHSLHEMAHVETDECGAPEFFSNGTKVLLVLGGERRKIDPAGDRAHGQDAARTFTYPKPRVGERHAGHGTRAPFTRPRN